MGEGSQRDTGLGAPRASSRAFAGVNAPLWPVLQEQTHHLGLAGHKVASPPSAQPQSPVQLQGRPHLGSRLGPAGPFALRAASTYRELVISAQHVLLLPAGRVPADVAHHEE